MTKKLEMVFALDTGKSMTLSLADPKDGLTKAEVEAAMNEIITKNAFLHKAGKLASIKEMNMQTSDTQALA